MLEKCVLSAQIGFPVYSHLSWDSKSKTDGVSQLVYNLKESRTSFLAKFLSEGILSKFWNRWSPLEEVVLIPIPSSTGRRHSLRLARSLGELTGFPVMEVLSLSCGEPQRGKRIEERLRREFHVVPQANLQNYKTVLLIDDVTTTGASLRAAQKALPKGLSCIGLTAFYRTLSTNLAES